MTPSNSFISEILGNFHIKKGKKEMLPNRLRIGSVAFRPMRVVAVGITPRGIQFNRPPPFSSLVSKHYMSLGVRPVFQLGRFVLASTGTAAAFGAYKASGNGGKSHYFKILLLISACRIFILVRRNG